MKKHNSVVTQKHNLGYNVSQGQLTALFYFFGFSEKAIYHYSVSLKTCLKKHYTVSTVI